MCIFVMLLHKLVKQYDNFDSRTIFTLNGANVRKCQKVTLRMSLNQFFWLSFAKCTKFDIFNETSHGQHILERIKKFHN